jgi:hypothetical protein
MSNYTTPPEDLNQAFDWIRAVVVVGFDLNIGQKIDDIYGKELDFFEKIQMFYFILFLFLNVLAFHFRFLIRLHFL